MADALVPLRNRSAATPVTRCPTACNSAASPANPMERRRVKLCLAEAASRSASSSTPTTSPRDVTTGMCRRPHSSMSISTVSAVRSAVTRRAGALITCSDRRVDRDTCGDHPGAQIAIGEDAEFAVRQPDQRIGHVVLGHPAHRVPHRCVGRDHEHVGLDEVADGPAVGRRRDRRRDRPGRRSTPWRPETPDPRVWRTGPAPARPAAG